MLKRKKDKRDIGGESEEDQALEAGEEAASEEEEEEAYVRAEAGGR